MTMICAMTPGCTPEQQGDLIVHSPHCQGFAVLPSNVEVAVTPEVALSVMRALSGAQRLEIMAQFCPGCGRDDDPRCHCWDDS